MQTPISYIFKVEPLNGAEWGVCIAIGVGAIPYTWVCRIIMRLTAPYVWRFSCWIASWYIWVLVGKVFSAIGNVFGAVFHALNCFRLCSRPKEEQTPDVSVGGIAAKIQMGKTAKV